MPIAVKGAKIWSVVQGRPPQQAVEIRFQRQIADGHGNIVVYKSLFRALIKTQIAEMDMCVDTPKVGGKGADTVVQMTRIGSVLIETMAVRTMSKLSTSSL